MTPIKVNSSNNNVSLWLDKYAIWHFWQKHRNQKQPASQFDDPIIVPDAESGYPCFKHDQIDQINASQSDVIFIDNISESINSQEYFKQYRSDKKYVIFSNGQWSRDRYPLPINYVNIYHHCQLLDFAVRHFDPYKLSFYFDKNYRFEPKPMLFVSTTGSLKHERDLFFEKLLNKISYKNFILRYSGQDLGMPAEDWIDFLPGEFDSYNLIPGFEKFFVCVSDTLPINIYNQGYFNLLLEGDIDWPDQICVSEKTAKCLVTGMPFVMVASPKFLQYIRNLGFRTYQDLWDESYDDIDDYHQRMDKLVGLVQNLEGFDWIGHQKQLQEIGYHNKAQMCNLSTLAEQEFLELERSVTKFLL